MCSGHFEDEDYKFIDSRTKGLKDGSCLLFLRSTKGYLEKKWCFVSSMIMLGVAAKGQENSGKN